MSKSTRRLLPGAVLLLILGITAVMFEPSGRLRGWLAGEAFFEGRPSHVWRRQLLLKAPDQREAAVEKLRNGGADSVAVLRELLGKAAEANVRWTAAELLGGKQGAARDASADLLAALRDSDSHVRTVAATAVPKVETPAETAVPALLALLEKDPAVPVIRALSVYGAEAKPALTALLKIMDTETLDIEVRWNAIRTIGKMREAGADAIPSLLPMLANSESRIREHSAEALGDIGPPSRSVVERLYPLLTDPDTKVRRDSVRSIGQIGAGPEALPLVEKLVKDPEQIVRDAATKTLSQLRDQPQAPTSP